MSYNLVLSLEVILELTFLINLLNGGKRTHCVVRIASKNFAIYNGVCLCPIFT